MISFINYINDEEFESENERSFFGDDFKNEVDSIFNQGDSIILLTAYENNNSKNYIIDKTNKIIDDAEKNGFNYASVESNWCEIINGKKIDINGNYILISSQEDSNLLDFCYNIEKKYSLKDIFYIDSNGDINIIKNGIKNKIEYFNSDNIETYFKNIGKKEISFNSFNS